jgi:hypothetical protein
MAGARAKRGKEAVYAGLRLDRSVTFWQPRIQAPTKQKSARNSVRKIGASAPSVLSPERARFAQSLVPVHYLAYPSLSRDLLPLGLCQLIPKSSTFWSVPFSD